MNIMERTVFLVLVLSFLSSAAFAAMSEAQVKAAGKLVRNMCQPKHKATDEDITKMHSGDWDIDRTAMCYMQCVLASNKLMAKDNTLDYEFSLSLAKQKLPASLRDGSLSVIEKCKDSAKTLDDKCVAAYEIAKCIYFADPVVYFLP